MFVIASRRNRPKVSRRTCLRIDGNWLRSSRTRWTTMLFPTVAPLLVVSRSTYARKSAIRHAASDECLPPEKRTTAGSDADGMDLLSHGISDMHVASASARMQLATDVSRHHQLRPVRIFHRRLSRLAAAADTNRLEGAGAGGPRGRRHVRAP